MVLAVCLVALAALFPKSADLPRTNLWTWVTSDPEYVLLTLTRAMGWLLAAWLFTITALTALGAGAGAGSHLAIRVARLLTPRACRHLLEATLGAALALGPAGSALAGAPNPPVTSAQASFHLAPLPPVPAPIVAPPESLSPEPALPNLDRPGASSAPPASKPRRPGAPKPQPAKPRSEAPRPQTQTQTQTHSHLVAPGDTLWAIAADRLAPRASAADITRAWQQWYTLNRAAIGPDPGYLLPGELLRAPQAGS